jgi:GxxExxY protein
MPIHCPIKITNLSADEFAAVDYRVMGHAYTCHNDLGRLCDECAYEADLKTRLLADGLEQVHTQVPLTVSHKSFSKTYQLDLVVENALYELKAATRLIGEHDTQILNYMLLLGLGRGKLLNFRPVKVEGQIRATSLGQEDRRKFTLIANGWQELTPACGALRQTLVDLLTDWGAFLDFALYQEALTHLHGGAEVVEQRIPLSRNGAKLGTQRLTIHAPGIAFRLTAFTEDQLGIEHHLRRLLSLTDLRALQWINFNHNHIELQTLMRSGPSGSTV